MTYPARKHSADAAQRSCNRNQARREDSMQYAISIGAIAVTAVLWTAAASAQIMDYGKYPAWSGQWLAVPNGGPPRYDPSKPPGRGQQAPLKPEYAAIHEASLKDQAEGGQGIDIGYRCVPSGVPRQMSAILQSE